MNKGRTNWIINQLMELNYKFMMKLEINSSYKLKLIQIVDEVKVIENEVELRVNKLGGKLKVNTRIRT